MSRVWTPCSPTAVSSGHLHATVSPVDALENADVSLLCVGTPSTTSGETNLTYIYRVVEDLIQPLKIIARRRGHSTRS